MATSQFVPVHPQTLQWIRIELGLSLEQVAKKTVLPIAQLENWENGREGITLSQAKKLATKYKVSLPFLYLTQTPQQHRFKDIVDFRRARYRKKFSDRLCLAIKTAHARQVWMREFLQAEQRKPLNWLGKFSSEENVQNIATACRQWLEVKQQEITDLKDDKAALGYWTDKIEAKGVIVASNETHNVYKIDRTEYSGMVLYDEYAPLILLNPADTPAKRIFTLMHELAHLLIRQESSVSLTDVWLDKEYDAIELFCNDIASHILIPQNSINQLRNAHISITDSIKNLTHTFKISHSAIAVAIKKYGIITQEALNDLLDLYRTQYQRNQKNQQQAQYAPKPDKKTVDRCGKLLITHVLSAYEQGSINASEVYDVLGMKLKYLGDLSRRLGFPLHRWVS